MDIKRVGILRGGVGNHYESSLQKGGDLIFHISENLSDKYKATDILIDKESVWYINGVPIMPADLMHKVDVVWNVSHQSFSNILESFSVPSVGILPFFSLLGNTNREMLKKNVRNAGIEMPQFILLPLYQKDFDGPREKYVIKKAKEVFEKFGAPWIVKPASLSLDGSFTPDSNMGIHLAKTFPELVDAIEDGVNHEKSILIEEFILGKIGSVHSVTGFRGEDIYVFPPINFTSKEKEKIILLIKKLHKHLGAKHYLKSDFVLHPKRGFFLTSVDFSPDLRKGSHFEQSCEYVGAEMHHIIEHILEQVL